MASFLAVYIQEAHARDEWPIGKTISFCDQPKTVSARCDLASKMIPTVKFPVLVDAINNPFQTKYAAWPFRFYIFFQDKIVLKAQPNPETCSYELDEIDQCLNSIQS